MFELVSSGLPHSDQGKIPSDFLVLSTFSLFLVSKYKLYSTTPDSIGGSKGRQGCMPPWVQFLSFSCSFQQKSFKKQVFGLILGVDASLWEILDLPLDRYITTNINNPKYIRVCYKKIIPLLGCPPTQTLLQNQIIVDVSHHNPGHPLIFETSKMPLGWRSITWEKLFKKVLANSPCFPIWKIEHPNSLFSVLWQPCSFPLL